jgi:hypothetical protein
LDSCTDLFRVGVPKIKKYKKQSSDREKIELTHMPLPLLLALAGGDERVRAQAMLDRRAEAAGIVGWRKLW